MQRSIWTINFITCLLVFGTGLIAGTFSLGSSADVVDTVAYWALSLAGLLAINDLYRHGTFSKSRWQNLPFLFAACFIAGALARVQHWAGGSVLTMVAWGGLALLYTIWFITKPVKKIPDVLKAIWVILFSALTLLRLLTIYSPGIGWLMLSTSLLYGSYVPLYIHRRLHPPRPAASEWDFDREPPAN